MAPKKALSQLCFPAETPIREVISLAHKAEFDGVELKTSIEGDINFNASREDLKKIYDMLKDFNLETASVSNGANWTFPLTSPDENIRMKGIEYAKKTVEIAYHLEANAILLVPGNVTEDIRYDRAWNFSLDSVIAVGKHALNYGVTVAVEEVWNKLILTPLEMERFVKEANEAIGEEIVGVYFDIANIVPFGYPDHWILYLKDKIKRVHVKDFRVERPGMVYTVLPPYGSVNWPKVMKALEDIGYESYLTAEIPVSQLAKETTAKYISMIIDDLIKLAW
ncbi:MAG: hypothetical protein B6U94_06105 [Thermofilum sp. ex4484_79]|nr:MAG: hypothetical protein B6U94_06105 [Thermofilum sp. ex4484_79]